MSSQSLCVVIPAYKVRRHILKVIDNIGPEVDFIIVVDDCCPENSGNFVDENCLDKRVKVIQTCNNLGVGGAVLTGYLEAIKCGADIIIKIDGDGQMDPTFIAHFVGPIIAGQADYTKGNRFYNIENAKAMPKIRIFGNAILSFLSKFSTGYWNIFDPTNGYTAIHSSVASKIPYDKISKRYFFETDILFRLNTIRAVVEDIPIEAIYGDEESNLHPGHIAAEFFFKHIRNFFKRIFYNYYLRDMSIASIELPLGILLLTSGTVFGISKWIVSAQSGDLTSAGTVMLAALPIILGSQLIIAFFNYDISAIPRKPLSEKFSTIQD